MAFDLGVFGAQPVRRWGQLTPPPALRQWPAQAPAQPMAPQAPSMGAPAMGAPPPGRKGGFGDLMDSVQVQPSGMNAMTPSAPNTAPPEGQTATGGYKTGEWDLRRFTHINNRRVNAGLPPITMDASIAQWEQSGSYPGEDELNPPPPPPDGGTGGGDADPWAGATEADKQRWIGDPDLWKLGQVTTDSGAMAIARAKVWMAKHGLTPNNPNYERIMERVRKWAIGMDPTHPAQVLLAEFLSNAGDWSDPTSPSPPAVSPTTTAPASAPAAQQPVTPTPVATPQAQPTATPTPVATPQAQQPVAAPAGGGIGNMAGGVRRFNITSQPRRSSMIYTGR